MTHTKKLTTGQIMQKLGIFKKCTTKVLTSSGREGIDNVLRNRGQKTLDSKWRIRIPESEAIQFNTGQPNAADGLQPEFYGNIVLPGEKWPFASCNICVNVWSSRKNLNYWPSTDSEMTRREFEDGKKQRLILRVRFDQHEPRKGKSKFHHPWFHMQIGGKSRVKHFEPTRVPPVGYYRYPPTIDTPRFPAFPMSFILVGRFILANFHPEEYARLTKDDDWKSLIENEERIMWTEFLDEYSRHMKRDLNIESCFDRTSMNSSNGWPNCP